MIYPMTKPEAYTLYVNDTSLWENVDIRACSSGCVIILNSVRFSTESSPTFPVLRGVIVKGVTRLYLR